jgi:hypothetical protein
MLRALNCPVLGRIGRREELGDPVGFYEKLVCVDQIRQALRIIL